MQNDTFKASCYYHVYNRGNNRETIFKSPENYLYFLKLLKKYISPVAELFSYCLLPNHFHLVLKLKDDDQLPENIRKGKTKIYQPFSNFFNAYAKAINKQYNRTGSLFQKNVRRTVITDEDQLRNVIIYVTTNSNHHDFVDYKRYRYSAYRRLLKRDQLLSVEQVLDLFDGLENFKKILELKKDKIVLGRKQKFE